MPAMRGDELAKWFQVNRPSTEIVFLSSNPTQHLSVLPCRAVEKPFVHFDTLAKTFRAALDDRLTAERIASIAA